jgi:hypothetical protein
MWTPSVPKARLIILFLQRPIQAALTKARRGARPSLTVFCYFANIPQSLAFPLHRHIRSGAVENVVQTIA